MKKKMVNVLLSVAVITTMMLSATACGSKTDDIQNTGATIDGLDIAERRSVDAADVDEDEDETDIADEDETEDAEGDETEDADVNEDETEDADEDETEDVDGTDAGDVVVASGSASLEEWTKSEECAQFAEMMDAGLEGLTISFEVDADTLSMIFTTTEAVDVNEGAEQAMNAYFTTNAAIFEAIRDQLISETGNENTVLKLVYRNADDSEIFSKEF